MNIESLRELCEYDLRPIDAVLPCPSPDCNELQSGSDRYCDACGTWIGLESDEPPTTGPLKKILINTGALRIVGLVERAEESLNSWCQ
jgi:hypothetical protein